MPKARAGGLVVELTLRGQRGATGNAPIHGLLGPIDKSLLDDDTTVFSVAGPLLRLISDHRIQKGPAFPKPMETMIDARTGQVSVTYTDDDGKTKQEMEKMDLPPDVSNGMMAVSLRNMDPQAPATLSYVAATPKPILVKLHITNNGLDPFSAAGRPVRATHYVVKIDLGGVKGLIAPLVGKQSPDFPAVRVPLCEERAVRA